MKMRCHKIILLPLSILMSCILAGCPQVHGYFDSYTRTKPNKSDLIGTYTLTAQTVTDQPVANLRATDGSSTSTHKLFLMSDGSFSAVGIPDCVKDKNGDWQIRKFISGKGRWELDSYTLDKKADGVEGTIWSLAFKNSGSLDGTSLVGERAPYTLVMEFDEDGWRAMEFERE